MRELFVIDRIDEDIAVCERLPDGEQAKIALSELPDEATEGSVIALENAVYSLDQEAQEERHKRIQEKMKDLFQ